MSHLNSPTKEGLQIHRFHARDYLNSPTINYAIINLEDYDYISIYCTGAINSFANIPGDLIQFFPEADLFLEFSDKCQHWINGEERNIPVRDKKWAKIYFQTYSFETADFQGFYGDLILVCSVRPIANNWEIAKESPAIQISNSQFPATTTKNYWGGIVRPNSNYTTIIPYVPMGYDELSYLYYTNAVSHSLKIYEYAVGFDDSPKEILNISASGSGDLDLLGSGRHRVEITNNDVGTKIVKLWLVWKKGFAWTVPV